MRIKLRDILLVIAMTGISLALAIQARKAANTVEYAGDSNLQTIEQTEAVFPYALAWAVCLVAATLIWWQWSRPNLK